MANTPENIPVQQARGLVPRHRELRIGDVVYVRGFEIAQVINFGCCIRRGANSRGGSNRNNVHIQYADGTFFHARITELHLVRPDSQLSTTGAEAVVSSRCSICEQSCVVMSLSCKHSACPRCWSQWANAHHGHGNTLRCLGDRCQLELTMEVGNSFWDLFARFFLSSQQQQEGLIRWLVRRWRLQMNPLFPPSMQVNCRQPGCYGLGYTGSGPVMCFFCEDQWTPGQETDQWSVADVQELIVGTKSCPKCRVLIEKDGGCDHMTCPCGHNFWWTTLQPYP